MPPHARAFERRARALHRTIDIGCGRIGNRAMTSPVAGIAHIEHLAVAGFDFAAVDEIAVDLDIDGAGFDGMFMISPFDDDALRAERRQHAFFWFSRCEP